MESLTPEETRKLCVKIKNAGLIPKDSVVECEEHFISMKDFMLHELGYTPAMPAWKPQEDFQFLFGLLMWLPFSLESMAGPQRNAWDFSLGSDQDVRITDEEDIPMAIIQLALRFAGG